LCGRRNAAANVLHVAMRAMAAGMVYSRSSHRHRRHAAACSPLRSLRWPKHARFPKPPAMPSRLLLFARLERCMRAPAGALAVLPAGGCVVVPACGAPQSPSPWLRCAAVQHSYNCGRSRHRAASESTLVHCAGAHASAARCAAQPRARALQEAMKQLMVKLTRPELSDNSQYLTGTSPLEAPYTKPGVAARRPRPNLDY
jgi:hypothetical protein